MSNIATVFGTRTAFGLITNINNLANAEAKPLGAVDLSSELPLDVAIDFQATLAAAAVSATGSLGLFLIEGPAGGSTDYTDGIDPAGTANIAASLKNAMRIQTPVANVVNQVVRVRFRLREYLSSIPKFFSLVLLNSTGAAIIASGNDANWTPIKRSIL